METEVKMIQGRTVHVRPNSSDGRAMDEVIQTRIYRRVSLGFDVEAGEIWLDLGANVGAFAVYCAIRNASVVCFEPDPDSFRLLQLNAPEADAYQTAVTALTDETLPFYRGRGATDFYRNTAFPTKGLPVHSSGSLPNVCGDFLRGLEYDGVKMDIEGAEGGLLDAKFLPKCRKLVMEYHTSRDRSIANLRSRLDFLKSRFTRVSYPPEYDRAMASDATEIKTYFDRMVFAIS